MTASNPPADWICTSCGAIRRSLLGRLRGVRPAPVTCRRCERGLRAGQLSW